MSARFEIRSCRRDDFDAVLQLLRQLWPDKDLDAAAVRKVFDGALAADSQVYLCAVDAANLVGFVSLSVKNNLWQAANFGHIDELIVDEKCRVAALARNFCIRSRPAPRRQDVSAWNWIQPFTARKRIVFMNSMVLKTELTCSGDHCWPAAVTNDPQYPTSDLRIDGIRRVEHLTSEIAGAPWPRA
jgi:hypothetical protein